MRVYEAIRVEDNCACSREKIEGVFNNFSAEEVQDSVKDGKISVTCEFCSTTYEFDPAQFAK